MRELAEKIKADIEEARMARQKEIETLSNAIEENTSIVKECEEIIARCTINGDSKGFKEAKEKYKDSIANIEVFKSRLMHIDKSPLIDDETTRAYHRAIQEKQKELYISIREKTIKTLEELKQESDIVTEDLVLGNDCIRICADVNSCIMHSHDRTKHLTYNVFDVANFVKQFSNYDQRFREV